MCRDLSEFLRFWWCCEYNSQSFILLTFFQQTLLIIIPSSETFTPNINTTSRNKIFVIVPIHFHTFLPPDRSRIRRLLGKRTPPLGPLHPRQIRPFRLRKRNPLRHGPRELRSNATSRQERPKLLPDQIDLRAIYGGFAVDVVGVRRPFDGKSGFYDRVEEGFRRVFHARFEHGGEDRLHFAILITGVV